MHLSLCPKNFVGGPILPLIPRAECAKVTTVVARNGKIAQVCPQRAGVGGWKPRWEETRLVRPGAPANPRRQDAVTVRSSCGLLAEAGWYRGRQTFVPVCGAGSFFIARNKTMYWIPNQYGRLQKTPVSLLNSPEGIKIRF